MSIVHVRRTYTSKPLTNPECLSTDEWIDKCSKCTQENTAQSKNNKISIFCDSIDGSRSHSNPNKPVTVR